MRWLSENYKWLFDGVGGAAIIALIVYLLQRWVRRSPEATAIANIQKSSGDNSPVASSSTQVINSPTFSLSLPAPPPPATPSPKEDEEQSPSCLNFVQPRSVLLHQNNAGVWYEASANLQQAHRGLVAQFRNRPNKVGQTAPKASSVSASLIFRSPEISEELHINHAVWLGRYEYVASFRSGETHQLLLAVKLIPFVTYDNPNSSNPFAHRFRSGMSIHQPQAFALGKEGEVEITLVDAWNVTVFTGLFDYRLSADEMYLKQKS